MNILIINAGCSHFGKGGTLSATYVERASQIFEGLGHQVVLTDLNQPWDIAQEAEKVKTADILFIQTPGWWMSTPWQLKKYEDEVFVQPGIASGDGRHRDHPERKYGTGGQLTNKRYMISTTWNAPKEAFEDPNQFFGGIGIDGVLLPLHKTFEFIGIQPMPTFMANDVFKNPTMEEDFARFDEHLRMNF